MGEEGRGVWGGGDLFNEDGPEVCCKVWGMGYWGELSVGGALSSVEGLFLCEERYHLLGAIRGVGVGDGRRWGLQIEMVEMM